MNVTPGNVLLVISVLLLLSILAGKTSARLGVPTLILFLVVGILAGSEGIGGIYFDSPVIAQFIGITALIFILFAGGLDTHWKSIKPVFWKGITLSTAGVFITAAAVGLFVNQVLGFTLVEGLLLGAIVSATDAAAVFSILRSKNLKLKNNIGPLLELESGSNDPMSYFLTISFTALIASGESNYLHLIPHFFQEFIIGAVVGFAMGKISVWLINNIQLNTHGVYPVLLLALAVFTYAITDFVGGNGFLAVYLCGLLLGNTNFIHKDSLTQFYDGQAWLMQIILFLTLGLLVFPSRIIPIAGTGLLIAGFLILVARPLSVFISLAFFKVSFRSKLLISWVGLRGAVPIVFATYPLIAGLEKAQMIFNLVFFISVSSVIFQGTTLAFIARILHLVEPHEEEIVSVPIAPDTTKSQIQEVSIERDSPALNKKIVQLDIPKSVRIIAIKRNNSFITPDGFTKLLDGDILFMLANDAAELALAHVALKK